MAGSEKVAARGFFRIAWEIYFSIGVIIASPEFLSYFLATPYCAFKLASHGATLPQILVASITMYGTMFVGTFMKIIAWPYSMYFLLTGQYPSFISWLLPGFFNQPTLA